jgi:hypothetical protein
LNPSLPQVGEFYDLRFQQVHRETGERKSSQVFVQISQVAVMPNNSPQLVVQLVDMHGTPLFAPKFLLLIQQRNRQIFFRAPEGTPLTLLNGFLGSGNEEGSMDRVTLFPRVKALASKRSRREPEEESRTKKLALALEEETSVDDLFAEAMGKFQVSSAAEATEKLASFRERFPSPSPQAAVSTASRGGPSTVFSFSNQGVSPVTFVSPPLRLSPPTLSLPSSLTLPQPVTLVELPSSSSSIDEQSYLQRAKQEKEMKESMFLEAARRDVEGLADQNNLGPSTKDRYLQWALKRALNLSRSSQTYIPINQTVFAYTLRALSSVYEYARDIRLGEGNVGPFLSWALSTAEQKALKGEEYEPPDYVVYLSQLG